MSFRVLLLALDRILRLLDGSQNQQEHYRSDDSHDQASDQTVGTKS